jgi:hypothetical protein
MAKKKTPPPTPHPKRKPDVPLVLYVIKGTEPSSYFGYKDFDAFDHGEHIAVYELREVRTLHVTRGLR